MEAVFKTFNELGEAIGITSNGVVVSNIIFAVFVWIVGWLLTKLIVKLISRGLKRGNVEKSLHIFIKSTVKFVLYFIVLVIVLGILGIPVTTFIAVLSVVGLAISLAIQNSLTNLTGGISILATKPFKVGDFIEACGVSGTVKEIGLFYTSLNTADKKLVFVPNGKVSSDIVTNYNGELERKLTLKFNASYDEDIEKVKDVLKQVVDNQEKILNNPAPLIHVSAYLDSSIEYIVAVWVKREDYWDMNWYLLEEVKHAFDKNNIEMTYNHLNIHMVNN